MLMLQKLNHKQGSTEILKAVGEPLVGEKRNQAFSLKSLILSQQKNSFKPLLPGAGIGVYCRTLVYTYATNLIDMIGSFLRSEDLALD